MKNTCYKFRPQWNSSVPVLLFFFLFAGSLIAQDFSGESKTARDSRMQWWRQARFGMFIHWGVYSVPARGEWVMYNEKIPVEDYEKFPPLFNPVKFNATEWVNIAKAAGMKYIVITSKHHDGFGMWDSKVSPYNVVAATPFKRDVLKELSEACRAQGVKICFYHSIMDWHHKDAKGKSFPSYRDNYLKPQLEELLKNYGPLGVLWFDGEWIPEWTEGEGRDLYNQLRAIQPDLIINNRVGKGRMGMAGLSKNPEFVGDFGTPEQEIPASGLEGIDWESCMTMNDHWGYAAKDSNWKSVKELIRDLVEIASKGGNFLLNVGPQPNGEFPRESVERLAGIGKWMNLYGESVYGTESSPLLSIPWGRCTKKLTAEGKTLLYLHVFDWPKNSRLHVAGLGNDPGRAYLMKDSSKSLAFLRENDTLTFKLPEQAPDAIDPVVVLEFGSELLTYHPPSIQAPLPIFLKSLEVSMEVKSSELAIHYTLDGSLPEATSPLYTEPLILYTSAVVKAASFYKGRHVSEVVQKNFSKVEPRPALDVKDLAAGLAYDYYEGEWDSLPDFASLKPSAGGIAKAIDLKMRLRDEKFALRFTGYISVPEDNVYTLSLESDDGSRFYIAGELVVDNDGLHGSLEKQGYAPLSKGLHPITITYFNKLGDKGLTLGIAPAGGTVQPVATKDLKHKK